MRRSFGSVRLIKANSLPASAGVAMMSLIRVLQKTILPAPIIAILLIAVPSRTIMICEPAVDDGEARTLRYARAEPNAFSGIKGCFRSARGQIWREGRCDTRDIARKLGFGGHNGVFRS